MAFNAGGYSYREGLSHPAAWAIGFLVLMVGLVCQGACLAVLWSWFFAPLLGLPRLGWPLATVLVATVDLIFTRQRFARLNRARTGFLPVTEPLFSALASCLFVAFAYFFHAHVGNLPEVWHAPVHLGTHIHALVGHAINAANAHL